MLQFETIALCVMATGPTNTVLSEDHGGAGTSTVSRQSLESPSEDPLQKVFTVFSPIIYEGHWDT